MYICICFCLCNACVYMYVCLCVCVCLSNICMSVYVCMYIIHTHRVSSDSEWTCTFSRMMSVALEATASSAVCQRRDITWCLSVFQWAFEHIVTTCACEPGRSSSAEILSAYVLVLETCTDWVFSCMGSTNIRAHGDTPAEFLTWIWITVSDVFARTLLRAKSQDLRGVFVWLFVHTFSGWFVVALVVGALFSTAVVFNGCSFQWL